MTRITLTVLVKETYRDRFSVVVEGCRRQGMAVEREMMALGLFSGNIESDKLTGLHAVEGVAAVEADRPIRPYC
ncbi:hypothetical protein [Advenella mimigardefordensis]|uniref:Uncharacterized protein n=1 Tax=Advenella mimigardefordensis (strain DSM 17166 / LMG 22922 / DPN7) TaxID=1247726 RepID=W0PCZ8_ADVMD|nr:hypothetical protein [Advenella mimigardefordensis]AHG64646.1 hypothetical protein MIM_c25760 [Advenella mimigardefordensis DPN7]